MNYQFGQSHSFFSQHRGEASRFRAAVARTLANRCHLTRGRLRLDGRQLNGYRGDPVFGTTDSSVPLYVFKAPEVDEWDPIRVGGGLERVPGKLGHFNVSVSAGLRSEQRVSDSEPFSTAGMLSIFYKRVPIRRLFRSDAHAYTTHAKSSQILWYRDGVIVHREDLEISGTVGMGLIIPADGLQTDLGGLVPVETEEKENRVKRCLSLMVELLDEFQERLGSQGFRLSGLSTSVGIGGVAGALLLITVPPVGVAVLARTAWRYSDFEEIKEQLNEDYKNGLAGLIDGLKVRCRLLETD